MSTKEIKKEMYIKMVNIKKIGKLGAFIVAFALLLTTMVSAGIAQAASGSSVEASSGILYGDYNNDGSIDAIDFAALKLCLLDSNHTYIAYMDLNLDNTIDALDFSILKKYLLGTVTTLPTGSTSTPGVLYIGRFDTRDSAGPKFAWSNTTIKANFQGTGISANLKSTGDNWFNVIIDGVVQTPINTPAGSSSSYTLASGLTNGTHTVELVKRTEAWIGDVQFLGFTVTDGSLLAPPAPSSKRIEFIGDSITCGYGNEGPSQYQSFTNKNENSYLAYGSVASRLLGADSITVSWSGKGIYRNYGGNTTDLMPSLYSRVLPYDTTLDWDYTKWTPQVVVLNLCTNDFSTGTPDETAFKTAYSSFVDRIRSQYPDAHIYCALGPMLSWDSLTNARKYISSVVTDKYTSGDTKVHFIEFPAQDAANGYGEDWHPSVKTHQLMADQLAAQLKTDLGW
jgi:lysophospholipase L1-like esterase